MQVNPIIVREFRARWRSWRAFAIVLGYATLLALAVGLLYAGSVRPADLHKVSTRRMAQIGHDLFLGLTAMQVFAWMLLAPALTATSIAGEREEGMLDLLQMSPLSPRRIVWGKMLAALSFIFLMMLAPIPITALCFLMGGVSPGEFYVAALLQSATAGTGAVIGLFCSAWCRRASTALALAFTIMGVWGFSSAFAAIFEGSMGRADNWWLKEIGYLFSEIWWRTNPLMAVFATTSFASTGFWFYAYEVPPWVCTVVFEVLLAYILLVYATRALRRPLQEPLEKYEPPKRAAELETFEQMREQVLAWSTPVPRQSVWWEAPLAWRFCFANPVLQREVQRKLRIRKPSRKIVALLLALGGIGLLLYLWGFLYLVFGNKNNRELLFWFPAFLYLVMVSVAAGSMSATAFPRERETHSWESLRLSLLTPRQIIIGKLWPTVVACWAATVIAFMLLLPCVNSWRVKQGSYDNISLTQHVSIFIILCASVWCYACWGLLISWWCRRSWIAVTVTIASLVFALVFVPLFCFIAINFNSSGDRLIHNFLRFWHPLFAMTCVSEQGYSWRFNRLALGMIVWPYVFVMFGAGCLLLKALYNKMAYSMRKTM